MRLSDLDEVIEAMDRASDGHAICAIDITGYCNCGFGDLRDRALTRLREMRENAEEGMASRWEVGNAGTDEVDFYGYEFMPGANVAGKPALLIINPREET